MSGIHYPNHLTICPPGFTSTLIMENAMKLRIALSTLIFCLSVTLAFSKDFTPTDSASTQTEKPVLDQRHSVGSTIFLLGNLVPGDHPHFMQLNYGYRLTGKEAIIVEAITWTYYEPLGTYESSEEKYPGKVSAIGIGMGYQRFYWKNLYSTVQATPFMQQFYDSEDEKIQSGFQLYLQFRTGYRFEFLDQRWFIEPSVTFNYWPVNTNFPASFEEIEGDSPNYFLFEPGLHFGFKF
ncbi:MAG: hypothetical protein P9L92_09485 [Candidatus Electryonea clarkiae]|nr:hypothetical protein [Candidatus Electryonea clarkiae]MDP8288645.1 hypothetical protein [Candidatus Electryonea clarkiae]